MNSETTRALEVTAVFAIAKNSCLPAGRANLRRARAANGAGCSVTAECETAIVVPSYAQIKRTSRVRATDVRLESLPRERSAAVNIRQHLTQTMTSIRTRGSPSHDEQRNALALRRQGRLFGKLLALFAAYPNQRGHR
jgi:hypothetical protein